MTSISYLLGGDLSEVWDFEAAVEELQIPGGTAKESVVQQIDLLEKYIENL